MELKETVIMDLTGTFRNEDLSKADFFDFVVPSDSNDNECLHQFTKQIRTVNAFLESADDSKETNNNTMLIAELPENLNENFETTLWNAKDTVKIETALLEDLNKYCWMSTGNEAEELSTEKQNTDEQIYTLTVLNGVDQSATWYRLPKADETISSPNSMEQLQVGLDIDSILNVIPGSQISTYSFNENNITTNTDGLIKSETYTYDENKDEITNAFIAESPMLEAQESFENNNNNNEWEVNNNNSSSNRDSPDSLLRSALQGKAGIRYNGSFKSVQKSPVHTNVELRKVLSTPLNKPEKAFIKEEQQTKIPTIVAGIDANGKIIFEEHIPCKTIQESDNTSSVDDLLLSNMKPRVRNTNRGSISQETYEEAANKLLNDHVSVRTASRQYGICHVSLHRYVNSLRNNEQAPVGY
ncbi:unnamed protein product [Psylliodes chrysocephalus]|uniref:HTH psq-type domain-containing protein n=1 Tax=Psylliodes chrysocephalus TaxID=3402493 RepID=A0A9P0CXR2_9CUCU|nr:unnamed protein product [Psylliodes chrysocephala]